MQARGQTQAPRGSLWCGLVLVAVLTSIPALLAGEKVKFSDTKTTPGAPEWAKKPERSNPLGGLLDNKSGSLSGVAAIPFSATSLAPARKLSARDRQMLEQRSNWIQRTPEDVAVTEKNAQAAVGVRDTEVQMEPTDTERRPKGDLETYAEKDKEKSEKDAEQQNQDNQPNGPQKRSLIATPSDRTPATERDSGNERGGLKFSGERSELLGSDPSGFAGASKFLDKSSDRNRESMRDAFARGAGYSGLGVAKPRSAAAEREQVTRSQEFSRILDRAASGEAGAKPITSAVDPVNMHPDLTRQELNPVIGQAVGNLQAGARPVFSDSVRPSLSGTGVGLSPLFDAFSAPAIAPPPFTLTPSIIQDQRRFQPSPFVLEIPKRSL